MIPEAISTAAQEGRAETVLAWLDADERHDVNDVEEESGFTLLIAAASDLSSVAHVDLARELIRRGADVNVVGGSSWATPLKLALLGGETPCELS